MKNLAILLLLLSTSVYGQKCKYIANKISGMDGTHLVITEPLFLSTNFGKGSVKVWSTIYGDTSLVVAFVLKSKKELILTRADSILIHIETGEVIVLELMQDPVIKQDGSSKSLTALTRIDKPDIEKFQNYAVNKITLDSGDTKIEGTPKKKKQPLAIQRAINCVLEYLKETK